MCDHEAFSKLRDDVDEIRQDVSDIKEVNAAHCAASDEKFKTIFGILKWIISFLLSITLILLLTVVYGAIGDKGFHSVAHEFNAIVK